jgi:hypothetical protein
MRLKLRVRQVFPEPQGPSTSIRLAGINASTACLLIVKTFSSETPDQVRGCHRDMELDTPRQLMIARWQYHVLSQ